MDILLHTIAVEPARWTPERVSRPFLELLPFLAEANFHRLEIYEPHLDTETTAEILRGLAEFSIVPVVLSSYLDLGRASEEEISRLEQRVAEYSFKKVRLFPKGDSESGCGDGKRFTGLIKNLAERMPDTMFLLETHDGTLADEPEAIAQIVAELGQKNVGLLYQPTIFKESAALQQLALQKESIRHIHLQNRFADASFSRLEEGVIPWKSILSTFETPPDATLEFVPAGICGPTEFDLQRTLQQAREETDYARSLISSGDSHS